MPQACEGKHRKLVDWLIENGDDNWEDGLIGACTSGDVSLIQLMIERGAKNRRDGFQIACFCGHVEASRYFIESGSTNFNRLDLASRHFEVKKLFIEYDHTRVIPIYPSDICPLLNRGVSLSTLLQYERPEATKRIVCLAEKLLEVVKSSLSDVLCADMVSALKSFIGYDVNEQVIESMIT